MIKRKHVRQARKFNVTFIRKNKKITLQGHDISKEGFSILTQQFDIIEYALFKGACFKVRIDTSSAHYIIQKAEVRNVIEHDTDGLTRVGFAIHVMDSQAKALHDHFLVNALMAHSAIKTQINVEKKKSPPAFNTFDILNQATWPKPLTGQVNNVSQYVCTDKGVAQLDFSKMQWVVANTKERIDATEITQWTESL